jgi:hypothetical protein
MESDAVKCQEAIGEDVQMKAGRVEADMLWAATEPIKAWGGGVDG